jgi:maleylpyruvate isomerase
VLVPEDDMARVAKAHERLLRKIEPLTDEDARRPSLLPTWSVGHVLTHLARHADSHVRRVMAAARGEIVDQYPGGPTAREAEIQAGSDRPVSQIIDDVRQTARAVDEAWRDAPPTAWWGRTRDANGRERPLFELPSRRWQEVEVHLVDIGVGVSHRDWSDDFVLQLRPRTRERLWDNFPPETRSQRFDAPADELAWLYGRLQGEKYPELPPWG